MTLAIADPATLTRERRRVLSAACDALLPALEGGADPVERDYFARSAGDRGIPEAIADSIPALAPHARAALIGLLDRLARDGFVEAPPQERIAALRAAAEEGAEGRFGVKQLKASVFGLLASRYDEQGRNPDWEALGYPGPATPPPPVESAPKRLPLEPVSGAEATLAADVCVVGSGAGGSVIAAELARAGRSVLVLEGGAYRTESDFRQLELEGLQDLYLDGGLIWSEDGSLGLIAGAALGGGTVINSMVCLRTPDHVRELWEGMGLDGVAGEEFDRHTDAVWRRLGVNSEATHFNRNTELMIAGLEARRMSHQRLDRNASPDDDPRFCGYCNAGCQQGCKRSTLKTYLEDAAAAGTRFLVDCRAERILVENGRARGVEATVGGETRVRVDAPTVVVACGGIESPALLLRSGIGGPAVGRYLRVHPTYMISGVYDERVEAWGGQIQSAASMDLTRAEDGGGFLIETLTLSPAMWAGHAPFVDPRRHREELLKLPHTASWHAVCHDHGSGRVVLADGGRPLIRWSLEDELDRRIAARAHVELARLHEAAGAREIYTFHWRERRWRRGDDLEAYLESLASAPADELTAFSAHQMGSCRMGSDPATAVADGRGELHGTAGVWVGDASALPTAPGVNPMITIMALASRTAERIAPTRRQPLL